MEQEIQGEEGRPQASPGVAIHADVAPAFTYASYQNAVPVLRALSVSNPTERAFGPCQLELTATPPFLRPKTWTIDRLASGDRLTLFDRLVAFDLPYLRGLDEAERGELLFVLRSGEAVLAEARAPVRLLARDEWGGAGDMAQLLPAFVMPNEPAVEKILRAASDMLAQHGYPPGMDGYQSGDPRRVRMLAAAIYAAVAKLDIHYAEPPASFEERGQKVRRPTAIAQSGLATCLDSSLLFAAAFEAAGLNPVLLLFEGHAAVAVWLRWRTLPEPVCRDPMEVRKAVAAGEMMVFETTGVTRRPVMRIAQAEDALRARLEESREREFRVAIDVRRLRDGGIMPLPSHEERSKEEREEKAPTTEVDLPPPAPEPVSPPAEPVAAPLSSEEKPTTPEGRIARWQKKLLDLTLRNRLLNFKDSKKTVPFLCTDVARLEDRLAAGAGIRIVSLPGQNPLGGRDADLYREMQGEDIHRRYAEEALARDELAAQLTDEQLEARLIDLYREARNDLAEGGTNTLFLAVGFLRWKRPGEAKDYRAPLLLIPVKLERVAATSRFSLRFHEDEPRFNATLLKFLKEEFDLALPQFEAALPTDGTGIDVRALLAGVRNAVRDVPGMEVVADTALSTFSFAKYLMWKDLVDRTELLRQSRLVRHLIDCPDAPFPGADAPAPVERDLDRKYAANDLVTILPADSSQAVASLMAAEGHDMVIIGPPGTGKSQTIANMIAHCLAVGKSVLFVAEKSAALNVVYRRLREHGLGPHCLELHSNKADRRHFLSQLRASWEAGNAINDAAWLTANARLQGRRDELNAYVDALHRPHANGLMAFDALGIALKGAGRDVPALSWPGPDAHDAEARAALEELADELGRTFAAVGRKPALRFVDVDQWSGAWQQELMDAASGLSFATSQLAAGLDGFLGALGLAARRDMTLKGIEPFDAFAAAVEACADTDHSIAFDGGFDKLVPAMRALESAVATARMVETQIGGAFALEEVGRIPLEEMDRDWRQASVAIWPLRAVKQGRVRNLLATYATKGKPDPQEMLPLLRRLRVLISEITASPLAGKSIGFAGMNSDVAAMGALIGRADELRRAFFSLALEGAEAEAATDAVAPIVMGEGDPRGVREAGRTFRAAVKGFAEAVRAFTQTAGCDLKTLAGAGTLAAVAEAMAEIVAARSALMDWSTWCAVRRKALAQGLGPLVEAVEAGTVAPQEAGEAFRLAYARWWLPLAIDTAAELRDFRRFRHEHAVGDFRKLDDLVRSLAAVRVRHKVAHGLPAVQSVPRNSELGLLRHQMELQRPSKSIREMIGAMPQSFGKLAPCMLMSPLSIAQYLPAGHAPFDVVIFDEASQITTWDAVGAIARGRQTVIVGDPKQLPPTNFFGRNEDDEEVEDHEKDLESILDEAKASGLPVRQLNWHYRSRDEALIAFSNHQYYGSRLITFPAPQVASRAVSLRSVPGGIYMGGQGARRTNPTEARAVADEAVVRMRAWLDLPEKARPTLGIITFNLPQQALIQDLLDKARRDAPEIEWFFAEERFEPTMVKNLENVQGDERDVILFSITYTKDAAGVRRMNFGALNREGGERRLNVAVTRARQELMVFSGTGPEHIDLERTKSVGAQHLKAFLDYAARGAVALAAAEKGSMGGPDSPFEEAVAQMLAERGWQVVPQVGVSGFRIDLGIKHPEQQGRYLAGIECDGATYHRSATARDRDKVREEVLRGLGWRILRIWSTDWWHDREGAAKRLDEALQTLLAEEEADGAGAAAVTHWELGDAVDPAAGGAAPPDVSLEEGATEAPAGAAHEVVPGFPAAGALDVPEATAPPLDTPAPGEASPDHGAWWPGDPLGPEQDVPQVVRLARLAAGQASQAYRLADLSGFRADPDQFYDEAYGPTLAAMVDKVLAVEAPVREDILAQRIARAHGWLRTGGRIKAQIARHAVGVARTRETSGDFLWRLGTVCDLLAYRAPADEGARRAVAEIPLAELAYVVDRNRHILEEDDPALTLARLLGIERLAAVTRPRLEEAIARAKG